MSVLNIHLQEGFVNDTVIILVDAREVYRKNGVTTRTQIGLADMTAIDAPNGTVDIDVEVPTRSQHAVFRVTLPDTPYVGVSLDRNGQLTHLTSAEILGYV